MFSIIKGFRSYTSKADSAAAAEVSSVDEPPPETQLQKQNAEVRLDIASTLASR